MFANTGRRSIEPPSCPECQAKETVPIVYGFPAHETFEAAERGEVVLGGCVLLDNNPRWACPDCKHRW